MPLKFRSTSDLLHKHHMRIKSEWKHVLGLKLFLWQYFKHSKYSTHELASSRPFILKYLECRCSDSCWFVICYDTRVQHKSKLWPIKPRTKKRQNGDLSLTNWNKSSQPSLWHLNPQLYWFLTCQTASMSTGDSSVWNVPETNIDCIRPSSRSCTMAIKCLSAWTSDTKTKTV